jgi:hypothetical protein
MNGHPKEAKSNSCDGMVRIDMTSGERAVSTVADPEGEPGEGFIASCFKSWWSWCSEDGVMTLTALAWKPLTEGDRVTESEETRAGEEGTW